MKDRFADSTITSNVPHLGSGVRTKSYVKPNSSSNLFNKSMQSPEQHIVSVLFSLKNGKS